MLTNAVCNGVCLTSLIITGGDYCRRQHRKSQNRKDFEAYEVVNTALLQCSLLNEQHVKIPQLPGSNKICRLFYLLLALETDVSFKMSLVMANRRDAILGNTGFKRREMLYLIFVFC